jgi:hypothetical protein
MRELISCITVSPSGRLTEPLKWTLPGGTALPSAPRSRLRLRSQHAVATHRGSPRAIRCSLGNTTPAGSMLTPRRVASPRAVAARTAITAAVRPVGTCAQPRGIQGLRAAAKAPAGLLSATSMTLARLGGSRRIGSPGSSARAASADCCAVGCSLSRSLLRRTLARRRVGVPCAGMPPEGLVSERSVPAVAFADRKSSLRRTGRRATIPCWSS